MSKRQQRLKDLKVGDEVIRLLAGKIPIPMRVSKIDDDYIHCGPWKFDRVHGMEVDEDLSISASYLQ